MMYLTFFLMLCGGYYCLTYGINLWKVEKNKLGGFGAILAAAAGTIIPIIYMLSSK